MKVNLMATPKDATGDALVCKIELTRTEANAIYRSLIRTMCKGNDLTVSMELEDKLAIILSDRVKINNDIQDEYQWNMIPYRCLYEGKEYRILDIDMQGGYFTLQDVDAKTGDVWVFNNIDMEKCSPII